MLLLFGRLTDECDNFLQTSLIFQFIKNVEKLIEYGREHVTLYALSDQRYIDMAAKNDVQEKIGSEMNTEGKQFFLKLIIGKH